MPLMLYAGANLSAENGPHRKTTGNSRNPVGKTDYWICGLPMKLVNAKVRKLKVNVNLWVVDGFFDEKSWNSVEMKLTP